MGDGVHLCYEDTCGAHPQRDCSYCFVHCELHNHRHQGEQGT